MTYTLEPFQNLARRRRQYLLASLVVVIAWRSHAHLLFANWINEVYQTTPFDLNAVGSCG
jgi:hypothetical protein